VRRAPAAAATAADPARPISSARPSHARHRVRSSERSRIQTALTTPAFDDILPLIVPPPPCGREAGQHPITGGTPTTRATPPGLVNRYRGHRRDVLPAPPAPLATHLQNADEAGTGAAGDRPRRGKDAQN